MLLSELTYYSIMTCLKIHLYDRYKNKPSIGIILLGFKFSKFWFFESKTGTNMDIIFLYVDSTVFF